MWGKWVTFSTPAGKKWAVRLLAVAIAVGCGFWLLPSAELPVGDSIEWQTYNADTIADAVSKGEPVVIKFTADWCTNCKVVDKKVYRDPEIVELIKQKGVFAVKADTTLNSYPATVDFKKVYGEAGNVPVTIVLLPGKEPVKMRGIFDKQELIDIIGTPPDRN